METKTLVVSDDELIDWLLWARGAGTHTTPSGGGMEMVRRLLSDRAELQRRLRFWEEWAHGAIELLGHADE